MSSKLYEIARNRCLLVSSLVGRQLHAGCRPVTKYFPSSQQTQRGVCIEVFQNFQAGPRGQRQLGALQAACIMNSLRKRFSLRPPLTSVVTSDSSCNSRLTLFQVRRSVRRLAWLSLVRSLDNACLRPTAVLPPDAQAATLSRTWSPSMGLL